MNWEEKFSILTKPLQAHEIELRIGSQNPRSKGFSLLLYKTARTDRNRLDEAFTPFGWQRDHKELKNVIYCGIGVKSESEWVWKWDAGAESYTEKQKGEASDSFKRAGFAWGIGIELYDSPFIWINWDDWTEKGKPNKAHPQRWNIVLKDEKKGVLGGFSILDEKGNLLWGAGVRPSGVEKIDYLKEIKEVWKNPKFEPFRSQLQKEFGYLPSAAPESVLEEYYNAVMNKRRYLK